MTTKQGAPSPLRETAQRLDKWLWFARVTKSRTLAATAVADGKIKVNRVRADKASQLVKIGDVVTSRLTRTIRVLKVMDLGARRGPPAEARQLYEDLAPPPDRIREGQEPAAWAERVQGSGRPTKRDRRLLDEFKRGG